MVLHETADSFRLALHPDDNMGSFWVSAEIGESLPNDAVVRAWESQTVVPRSTYELNSNSLISRFTPRKPNPKVPDLE
jgi:hypothetical protein